MQSERRPEKERHAEIRRLWEASHPPGSPSRVTMQIIGTPGGLTKIRIRANVKKGDHGNTAVENAPLPV